MNWILDKIYSYLCLTNRQTCCLSPHRLARDPLEYLCMVTVAQRILVYLIRDSHPLTRLWMITAAPRSLSALSLSRRATCPARKNILVFPKQYWSGSEMSWGRLRLHEAWACSWIWGPWRRRRYLLKNSSYVHLETQSEYGNLNGFSTAVKADKLQTINKETNVPTPWTFIPLYSLTIW